MFPNLIPRTYSVYLRQYRGKEEKKEPGNEVGKHVEALLQLFNNDAEPERAIDPWPLKAKGLIVLVSPN